MAKTKAKPKKSEKAKPKAAASKASPKSAKTAKSAEKEKVAAALKGKAVKASSPAKVQPDAAKNKAASASVKSSKAKSPKKESKTKKEELDLFDDGEVTESEELLEYEAELEVAVDESEEVSDLSSDEVLLEAHAAGTSGAPAENEEDIILTDAEGNRYCRAKDCDQISLVEGYCRYHYLLFWKKIQVRKEILQDGKLEKYVEDLTSRYPDKFLEMLKKDLRTTKDFLAAIAELEIDESAGENEFEEDAQTFIDEVRGLSDTGASMEDDEF